MSEPLSTHSPGQAHATQLPPDALLQRHLARGDFADCFVLDVPALVTLPQFVEAFYTSWLFKLERYVLQVLALKASTDEGAHDLAMGKSDRFAAWTVVAREPDQILLTEFSGRTSSWLMTRSTSRSESTQLYFGSSITQPIHPTTGKAEMGVLFNALLGAHTVYSRHLLQSAASRLLSTRNRS